MEYIVDTAKATPKQIRKAFERLNYNTSDWQFTTGIYLTFKGKIHNTHCGSLTHYLALESPNYRELPLEDPLFKVGDILTTGVSGYWTKVVDIDYEHQLYKTVNRDNHEGILYFKNQNLWRICTCKFKAGDPVLVRNSNEETWTFVLFSHYSKSPDGGFVAGNTVYKQCIPYKGNELLVGTSDSYNLEL